MARSRREVADAVSPANILFLYATQAESTRKRIYLEACRELTRTYGHAVVFCYNGPKLAGIDDLHVEHFDSWVEANGDVIEHESLIRLERRFPNSNLWRGVVIERNLTDYSFVGASFRSSKYTLREIEWYLKALVLFYDYVLARYRIDVAFNQVSDNIHAHIIYELARSKKIVPLSLGRGLYWFDEMAFPQTELSFGSRALRDRYRLLRAHPSAPEAGSSDMLDEQIARLRSSEARDERPAIIYTKTLLTITVNAIVSARDSVRNLSVRRPRVLDSNQRLQLWPAAKSYVVRLRNLAAMRWIVRAKDVPAEPFVFFPLHYQPEATLLGASPAWLDQLALVRLLSASLPAGHRLVVKDHPVIGGARAPGFYGSVKQLPNVVLLDERVSGRGVANAPNCALVATIGGTIGLEAMLSGKPVLMFGRVYYDCMDTVLKPPNDLNDLPQFLKRILVLGQHPRSEEITSDVRTFLAAWVSIMTPAGKATYWDQEDQIGAGRDWARLVHELSERVRTAELVSTP